MITYTFDTVLTEGKEKGKTLREVFEKNPRFIFETIKKWSADKVRNKEFSDEVLEAAHIHKHIDPNSVRIQQEEIHIPRTVMIDKCGKVRKRKKQDIDDEFTKDESFYYGPDYDNGNNNESQEWGDGFDDADDNW